MKTTYKELRQMQACGLRGLCIEKGWYTKGDNESYQRLLKSADKTRNITTNKLAEMAEDIIAHSDTGYDVPDVMFELARICDVIFVWEGR